MPFELSLARYEDMPRIVEVIYAANRSPYDPFVDLCCPGLDTASSTPAAQGMQGCVERYLEEWRSTLTQHWLKVVDTDTGKIISASKWEVFKTDPYAKAVADYKAEWLLAGTRRREYAEFLINARMRYAADRCRCPHVWLDICVTHPEYRRRGAASLGLAWGAQTADEMQVKSFVEASVDGAELYQRFGFVTTDIVDVKREDMEADADWLKLEKAVPLKFRWMERGKNVA